MSGIRVSGLPGKVTEKHLKMYFSNPRNGGGRILKIYHPLPHASAVVLFDDKRVVQEVLKRDHQFSGQLVDVSATPKQVFRRAVVEIEKTVSNFLSVNPQLVDELQFVGEINVNFQYEKERYLLDGSWYQMEWALHYLDTMLEAFQTDPVSDFERRDPVSQTQERATSGDQRRLTDFRDDSPPRSQQIKNPNIPVVQRSQEVEQPKSLPVITGAPMSNIRRLTGNQSKETADLMQKPKKNKNIMPAGGATGGFTEPRSVQSKFYGRTVRSNLDDEKQDREQTGVRAQIFSRGAQSYDEEDWKTGSRKRDAYSSLKNDFGRESDSDSENEATLAAAYDRRVKFTSGTNFEENKGRPPRAVPRMTEGIDVSRTDFGEAPLTFTFELPGNLKVHVAMDDITKQTTDTIVNPTTPDMSNVYGVSRAIMAAAGMEMQLECRLFVEENGPMNYTTVTHTVSGGSLSQKIGFVLHTAGPNWREEDSEFCTHMLVCTYINCFQYADEKLWVQSLATPLISAGAFGFPLDVCIGAFYDALLLFSSRTTTKRHLKEVHLVCFDQDSAMATIMIVQSLLDCDNAQSAVAATDRYQMRSSKYNFHAEKFEKPDVKKAETDESDNDDFDKGGNTNAADVDKPVNEKKEERQIQKEDIERADDLSDSDRENKEKVTPYVNVDSDREIKEKVTPYVNVGIAMGKPGQVASGSSFTEKFNEKDIIKGEGDNGDSVEDEVNEKEKGFDPDVLVKTAGGDPEKIAHKSTLDENLDLEKIDDDDDDYGNSDNDRDSNHANAKRNKVYDRNEIEDGKSEDLEPVVKTYDAEEDENREENAEDQGGKEERDEATELKRKVSGEDFNVSRGKTSQTDNEWSIVPGNDVTKDSDVSDGEENEKENEEELFL